jgi:type IV pilus assembly protein PilO
MNVMQELRNLDTNDPGRWPLPFRIVAVAIAFIGVTTAGIYMFVVKSDRPVLERAEREEQELRATFEQKQRRAANFDAYRAQLAEIERSFGTMLRQLPGRTEVPNLLVDISQTGLAAGLEEELFQPLGEVQREFYAELPIKIRLTGDYHEIGTFVSGIAALPRIVTLHDITIRPAQENSFESLILEVTAKTYRYLDEEGADG